MFRFSMKEVNEKLEVKLEGDLDIEGTEMIEEELIPAMEKYKVVNVNFEEVQFIDSSGMGLLLNLVQSLNGKGTKVTIANVREEVMEVFELLQIPDILGVDVFV